MDLDAAVRELVDALTPRDGLRRDAQVRAARQVLLRRCATALGVAQAPLSVAAITKRAMDSTALSARRDCAVLFLYALTVRGVVPREATSDVCALVETTLRSVLVRSDYPFAGTLDERVQALERLHRKIDELMQPFEPTFPNWQGLYAG